MFITLTQENQAKEAVASYRKCLEEIRLISGKQRTDQELVNEELEQQIQQIHNQLRDIKDPEVFERT